MMSREEATFIAAGLMVISMILEDGGISSEKQIAVSKLIKESAILIGKGHGVSSEDLMLAITQTMTGEIQ